MKKIRIGFDQVTAWILAVILGIAITAGLYFILLSSLDPTVMDERQLVENYDKNIRPKLLLAENETRKDLEGGTEDTGKRDHHSIRDDHVDEKNLDSDVSENEAKQLWTYGGDAGPNRWAGLHPSFKECADAANQSPIDLSRATPLSYSEGLSFKYGKEDATIHYDGRLIQVQFQRARSQLLHLEKPYRLRSLILHTPSEHHIEGVPYEIEAQLMHENSQGELLIVGVLFAEGGREQPGLKQILAATGKKNDVASDITNFDVQAFLPSSMEYFSYSGSLTTPPCSQPVRWIVFKQRPAASARQVDELVRILRYNARPLQPRQGREIVSGK